MKLLFFGTAGIVVAYLLLAWFFFGSPHPCGILEARQKPYFIQKASAESREHRQLAYKLIGTMEPEAMQAGKSMLESLSDQPERVTSALRRRIALMSPAECVWQAITWRPK